MRLDFQHVRWFVALGLGMTMLLEKPPASIAAAGESPTGTDSEGAPASGIARVANYGSGLQADDGHARKVSETDRCVACSLTLDGQLSMAIATIGLERSDEGKVKELAETIILDQKNNLARLKEFGLSHDGAGNTRTPISSQGSRATDDNASRASETALSASELIRIHEEKNRQSLELMKQELEQREKTDFDRVFLAEQLFAHLERQAEIGTLRQYASSDLAKAIDAESKTCNDELGQIRKLLKTAGDK